MWLYTIIYTCILYISRKGILYKYYIYNTRGVFEQTIMVFALLNMYRVLVFMGFRCLVPPLRRANDGVNARANPACKMYKTLYAL